MIDGLVLSLIVFMAILVGCLVGAMATRAGYKHRPPVPPRPPGRHSKRPDGGPERRRDYGAEPMPALQGPQREAVRPLGGSPGAVRPPAPEQAAEPATEAFAGPATREMRAPRPSPSQDMRRWREQQEQGGS